MTTIPITSFFQLGWGLGREWICSSFKKLHQWLGYVCYPHDYDCSYYGLRRKVYCCGKHLKCLKCHKRTQAGLTIYLPFLYNNSPKQIWGGGRTRIGHCFAHKIVISCDEIICSLHFHYNNNSKRCTTNYLANIVALLLPVTHTVEIRCVVDLGQKYKKIFGLMGWLW